MPLREGLYEIPFNTGPAQALSDGTATISTKLANDLSGQPIAIDAEAGVASNIAAFPQPDPAAEGEIPWRIRLSKSTATDGQATDWVADIMP